jgi:RNA polymerase sigma-70 factor (ECF subfamily)
MRALQDELGAMVKRVAARDLASVDRQRAQSDEALFQALLAGQREAFSTLFRRYQQPLYGFIARMAGDPTEAEDLLQEVFLRLLRQPAPLSHVKAWLYRTATNAVIDHRRHRRHETIADEPSLTSLIDRPESALPRDPGDRVAQQDVLGRALATLTEEQRVVVSLHYFGDLPIREVARVLGLPEGTVKSRLARAYRLLADALKREEDL